MRTAKIQLKGFASGIYSSNSPMWSFASKIDTTKSKLSPEEAKAAPGKCVGQVDKLNELMTCRESFIDVFRQQTRVLRGEVTAKNKGSFQKTLDHVKDYPIAMDATRILVGYHPSSNSNIKKIFEARMEQMKVSLRIANIVENELGWARTKLYKGILVPAEKDPRFPKGTPAESEAQHLKNIAVYMFIGSKKFMFAPHMLSLYLLFLRLGLQKAYANVSDMESLIKAAHSHSAGGATDASFVKVSYPYWLMFLKNWRDLYKSRYLLTNYSYDVVPAGDASVEGIDRLCRECCTDQALLSRFRALKVKSSKDTATLKKMAASKE